MLKLVESTLFSSVEVLLDAVDNKPRLYERMRSLHECQSNLYVLCDEAFKACEDTVEELICLSQLHRVYSFELEDRSTYVRYNCMKRSTFPLPPPAR